MPAMQEDKLYHYAVIRLVPRVEREEFFNVGLILFSKEARYIRLAYHLCPEKFRLMQSEASYEEVLENLETLRQIAVGNDDCGPVAAMDIPERFRWLTATRSSILQTSPTHPGKSSNLEETFRQLFEKMVL